MNILHTLARNVHLWPVQLSCLPSVCTVSVVDPPTHSLSRLIPQWFLCEPLDQLEQSGLVFCLIFVPNPSDFFFFFPFPLFLRLTKTCLAPQRKIAEIHMNQIEPILTFCNFFEVKTNKNKSSSFLLTAFRMPWGILCVSRNSESTKAYHSNLPSFPSDPSTPPEPKTQPAGSLCKDSCPPNTTGMLLPLVNQAAYGSGPAGHPHF